MFRFNLQFRGGAVDGCFGRTLVGEWSKWSVLGSIQFGPGNTGPAGPTGPARTHRPREAHRTATRDTSADGTRQSRSRSSGWPILFGCVSTPDQLRRGNICGRTAVVRYIVRRRTAQHGIGTNTHCGLLFKATMDSFRHFFEDLGRVMAQSLPALRQSFDRRTVPVGLATRATARGKYIPDLSPSGSPVGHLRAQDGGSAILGSAEK
jgi:hypothetical protein